MRFVVFIKQVPDTSDIMMDENGSIVREGKPSKLDPYCEYAVKFARSIKRENDAISVVSMGLDQAKDGLYECLRLGADEAYLLTDDAFAGADAHATSRTLSAFIKKFIPDYELIFCGERSTDGDSAQVPAESAYMLGAEQFYHVKEIVRDDGWKVTQDYGDETRICRAKKGSVISVVKADRDENPNQKNETSSNIEIKTINRVELGLGTYSVGLKGSKTRVIDHGSGEAAE